MSARVYRDRWGSIVDHPELGVLEIRWLETSAEMTAADFNAWLARFAEEVERSTRRLALVDARSFRMPPGRMDPGWRDAHIIPRYVAAGMRRFAFVMPAQMPLVGSPPAPEGPADFPTGYFGSREDALAWLAEA